MATPTATKYSKGQRVKLRSHLSTEERLALKGREVPGTVVKISGTGHALIFFDYAPQRAVACEDDELEPFCETF